MASLVLSPKAERMTSIASDSCVSKTVSDVWFSIKNDNGVLKTLCGCTNLSTRTCCYIQLKYECIVMFNI
jgi:hypothetical protein